MARLAGRAVFASAGLSLLAACGGGGGAAAPDSALAGAGATTSLVTASVSGTVRTAGGVPLAGATVTAYQTNDHSSQVTTTDANGRYRFEALPAGGPRDYELWVDAAGHGFVPTPAAGVGAAIRSDHMGLIRTVTALQPAAGAAVGGADFTVLDTRSARVALARSGQQTSAAAGDDGALQRGVAAPNARFAVNGDGTVTDRLTGLVWLQQAGCLGTLNWPQAVAAAHALASGACGLSDGSGAGQWRLPNIVELESLVDASQSAPALPAAQPFGGVGASYWSSTTYYGDVLEAWALRLSDGRYLNDGSINLKASGSHATWAVRDGSVPGAVALQASGQYIAYADGDDGSVQAGVALASPRFIDQGDGTVVDTTTGLVWLERADCLHADWAGALAAVAQLADGQCGLSDGSAAGAWRMPNRREMLSLADRALGNQADDFDQVFVDAASQQVERPAVFAGFVGAQFYWTSTSDAADLASAWTLYSFDFGVYDIPKSATGYTLAVR